MYEFCEKFGYLAFEDEKDVLSTVSYSAVRPDFVQIETPLCSRAVLTSAGVQWQIYFQRITMCAKRRMSKGSLPRRIERIRPRAV